MNAGVDNPVVLGRDVRKVFRRDKRETVVALDGVSVEAKHGTLTALVGPDGAGKTTLLRLIAGLLRLDGGELKVLDIDVSADPQQIQERIGYMPQKFGLYEDLSVRENLDLYADMHGISSRERQERYPRLMEMTALGEFQKRLAGQLSGGMKQKLGLACTLVRQPELLLLDEPTVGVDPLSRRELWNIILQLVRDQGLTVMLSTAYLNEAERCGHVVVLHQGKVLAQGPPADISRLAANRTFLIDPREGQPARELQSRLLDRPDVVDAVPEGGRVRLVRAHEGDEAIGDGQLLENTAVERTEPRFEDGFMVLLRRTVGQHSTGSSMTLGTSRERGNGEMAVEVRDLVRQFGTFTAVDHISFEVRRGDIFGLLGPNGAGKTTTFRMLCGLLACTSGTLRVAGVDLRHARASARQRIGYVAQKFSLYPQLSVAENLDFFGSAYSLRGKRKRDRIAWALEQFELQSHARLPCEQLPGGYKQRLAMAAALIHEPEILFLDEPTSGADPLARREFWRRITALAEQGVTVIVTTHFMEEAEYCDHIAILAGGRILAHGTPAEVRGKAHAESGRTPTMEDAFIAVVQDADGAGSSHPPTPSHGESPHPPTPSPQGRGGEDLLSPSHAGPHPPTPSPQGRGGEDLPPLSVGGPHPPTPSPQGRGGANLLPLSPGERGQGGEGFHHERGLGGEGEGSEDLLPLSVGGPHPPTPSPQGRGGANLLPLSPGERGQGGEGQRERGLGDEGEGGEDLLPLSVGRPHPPTASPQGRGGANLLPLSPGERGQGGEGFHHERGLGGEGEGSEDLLPLSVGGPHPPTASPRGRGGEDWLPLSPGERGPGGEGFRGPGGEGQPYQSPHHHIRAKAWRVWSLVRKESRQILRDPSSIAIGLVLPIILILLFGYGLSLDVTDVPVAVVVEDPSPDAMELAAGFELSPYFKAQIMTSMQRARELMVDRRVDGIVRIQSDFGRNVMLGNAEVQLLIHATDANRARIIQGYAEGAVGQWAARRASEGHAVSAGPVAVQSRLWFNDANDSHYFLVPGLIVLVMTLIGAMLTSLVMAREWERGTLEALFVSPVEVDEILLGKTIPYFVLGILGLTLCMLAAKFLFHVPIRGSVFVLVGVSMLYLLVALGIGLLISVATKNQFVASQMTMLVTFLPAFMLSGFLFDVRSMPTAVRFLTYVLPARYYVTLLQTLFLSGDVWELVVPNAAILAGMATALLLATRAITRKRLG